MRARSKAGEREGRHVDRESKGGKWSGGGQECNGSKGWRRNSVGEAGRTKWEGKESKGIWRGARGASETWKGGAGREETVCVGKAREARRGRESR